MSLGPQLLVAMEQQRFTVVLCEVAALGHGGLQINEPGTSRSLRPYRDLEGFSPGLPDPRWDIAAGLRSVSG